jgi:hypothetical protein
MGSGVPGGGADRSDDPITKPAGDDSEPRRMHNMRDLDDE